MIDSGVIVQKSWGTVDPKTNLITGVELEETGARLSDPRVNGTTKVTADIQRDSSDNIGYTWNRTTLENDGGSWVGTGRGFVWAFVNEGVVSYWLIGRGAYEGFTYTYTARTLGSMTVEYGGFIYRGSPPAP